MFVQDFSKQRVEWWLPGVAGWGKCGDFGPRIQASSYKVNKFGESNVQLIILYHFLNFANRADLKCSHYKNEMVTMWRDGGGS